MRKILTELLVLAVMLLFSAGFEEHAVITPIGHAVLFPAGTDELGNDSENQITQVDVTYQEPSALVLTEDSLPREEGNPGETVKDAIQADEDDAPVLVEQESSEVPSPPIPEAEQPDPAPAGDEHVHCWIDEIMHHEAVTHTVHHDAITEQKWVSVLITINHFYCDVCGKEFFSQGKAYAHEDETYAAAMEANDMSLIHSGHSMISETIDQGYFETVIIQEAYDEVIIDSPAWEEHLIRCSVCGAIK